MKLTVILGIAALVCLYLLMGLTPKPLLVNKPGFSQAVYDAQGGLLRLSLSGDEKFRLWTPISRIPKKLIDATLAQEDRNFYRHPGVNPLSLIRAAITTYVHGSRRVGGSTITMQLARMRFGIDSRGILGKIQQIARALQLERHYSKGEILEAYLNTAPYGSNIEGVGAASLVYFDHALDRLTSPEAVALSVIPQNPSKRTPSAERGILNNNEARGRLLENISLQDGRSPSEDNNIALTFGSRSDLPFRAPHFVERVLRENVFSPELKTTLNPALQSLVERQVETFVSRNRRLGMTNATALLVDYQSMKVQAYVGSADYRNREISGQVDGIRARRSPGSALKPFVYALALDQGLIHPQSVLKDTAAAISNYNPENFDREFLGPLSATDALVRSRNLPAIQLANRLRKPGLYDFLKSSGVQNLRDEQFYGLALVLGGVEVTMEELVKLYAMLANGGIERELQFIDDAKGSLTQEKKVRVEKRLISDEASYLVLEMLKENPRPAQNFGSNLAARGTNIPWKTGTSYAFRDAWAVGVVGKYVLAVWVGNFDGKPNPNFIGRDAAGPLLFSIVDAVASRETLKSPPPVRALNVKRIKVCAISGQLPGPNCRHLKDTWFIPGVSPIETCNVHREVLVDVQTGLRACSADEGNIRREVYEFWPSDILKVFRDFGMARKLPPPFLKSCQMSVQAGLPPQITSPVRNVTYAPNHGSKDQIALQAVADGDSSQLFWFIDDSFLGAVSSGESVYWRPQPGKYIVRVVDSYGRSASEQVSIVLPTS